jgi:integrase
MEQLRQRIEDKYSKPGSDKLASGRKEASLYEVCKEYISLRQAAPTRYAVASRIIRTYVMQGGDFIITPDALRERLKKNLSVTFGKSTARDCIDELKGFIAHLINLEIIERDPLRLIGEVWHIKDKDKERENLRWETHEVMEHIEYFERNGNRIWSLCLRLAYRTGMRPGEIRRMRWEHVHDTKIEILGKPSATRKRKMGTVPRPSPLRPREFPLYDADGQECVPGVVDVLTQLRSEFRDAFDGYVFPWRDIKREWETMGYEFSRCLKACGHTGRTLKSYRKSAIWYWDNGLGLPLDVRALLAGHGEEVQKSNYLTKKPTGEDIARKINLQRAYKLPQIELQF